LHRAIWERLYQLRQVLISLNFSPSQSVPPVVLFNAGIVNRVHCPSNWTGTNRGKYCYRTLQSNGDLWSRAICQLHELMEPNL
jgi:hypothetical protein